MGELLYFRVGPRRGLRRATSARTWYQRGCALEAADPGAAIVAYRRALAGQSSLADAHNNLGRLLHDRGELAEAEACYRRAIAVDADLALYHFNLGVALEDRGASDDAMASYERALALEPGLADAHFNLARQLEQVGRKTDDELALRRAVRHLARYRALVRSSG